MTTPERILALGGPVSSIEHCRALIKGLRGRRLDGLLSTTPADGLASRLTRSRSIMTAMSWIVSKRNRRTKR